MLLVVANENTLGNQMNCTQSLKSAAPDLLLALRPKKLTLQALYIHFVDYPQEVNYLVSPVSVVMTIVNGQLDATRFRTRALEAAEALSASSSSGR